MSRRRRVAYPLRVAFAALLTAAPAVLFALGFVWLGDHPAKLRWTVTVIVLAAWAIGTRMIWETVQRPLQTLSNLISALREGDYSTRGRGGAQQDALGALMRELNAFADLLREQRLGDLESAALLGKVMAEIDVVILACDEQGRVRLANRAAELLIGRPAPRLLGDSLAPLGLSFLLEGAAPRKVLLEQLSPNGEWELRRTTFRQRGRTHTLIVLTDLRRALREEEREAWHRLVRVLGHEINNSLAPIQSLAQNLRRLLARPDRPDDAEEDLDQGLAVIQRRAEALGRFMGAFTRLARLPPPRPEPVEIAAWVQRIAALETRLPVVVGGGPAAAVQADPDQLDQVLINLVRNAVDAALETGGGVRIAWGVQQGLVELRVVDDGPGLIDSSNLFVPFFTTKPEGTGIGLALSRQILENHGGTVRLENRADAQGCVATIALPIAPARTGDALTEQGA
jgi:two-component system nitrogen regulation sensor histidine kinase NtrY